MTKQSTVVWVVARPMGAFLYGKHETRQAAEEAAREHGEKYVARIDEAKISGTRGSFARYRVPKLVTA